MLVNGGQRQGKTANSSSLLDPGQPSPQKVRKRRIGLAILITVALITPFDARAGEGAKGWYLMEPPVDETSNFGYGVLDQAPLNQWKRIATFSTEAACEAKRKEAIQASRDETLRLSKTSPLPKLEIFRGAYRDSRLAGVSTCVSADDISTTTKGQQLMDLKKALDSGAMTQKEYETQRKKLLEEK